MLKNELLPFAMRIDLNADLGESFGPWTLGDDQAVLKSVTSANVACGYHAGDPGVMRKTVRLARAAGVAIGVHPGLADLAGFGRRRIAVSPAEVEDFVLYQIGALHAIAASEQVRLQHVKPHGALYNMAARDRAISEAIVRAIASFDRTLILFAPPDSELLRAAEACGLRVAAEGFADRTYEGDGSLTPRDKPGAVIHDAAELVARAVRMVREGVVRATSGRDIQLRVQTICTHGDTKDSAHLVSRLRAGFEAAGIDVKAVGSGDAASP